MDPIITQRNAAVKRNYYDMSVRPFGAARYPLDMETWRDRAKTQMQKANLTQDDVAELLGLTQGAIAHWLKGRREPRVSEFIAFAAAINCSPDWLLSGDPDLLGLTEEAINVAKEFQELPPDDKKLVVRVLGMGLAPSTKGPKGDHQLPDHDEVAARRTKNKRAKLR